MYWTLIGLPNIVGKELFVRGLPDGTDEKHVKKFFKKQSIDVESIKMIENKK